MQIPTDIFCMIQIGKISLENARTEAPQRLGSATHCHLDKIYMVKTSMQGITCCRNVGVGIRSATVSQVGAHTQYSAFKSFLANSFGMYDRHPHSASYVVVKA